MATPGQLTAELARLLDVPESYTANPWRILRQNGAVTKGGRGKSAARVTAADAANALIAVAADEPLKGTLAAWQRYRALRAHRMIGYGGYGELSEDIPFSATRALPKRHTVFDALVALLTDLAASGPAASVSVEFKGPFPSVEITIRDHAFKKSEINVVYCENPPKIMGDLRYDRSFSETTLAAIGQLVVA